MTPHDLTVVGAGAAGLGAARAARAAGRSVLLIDPGAPGGDCTFYGCVPSKTLLDLAHRVARASDARKWGVPAVGAVDFPRVMRRVREVVAAVAHDESAQQLRTEGIDVQQGRARFVGPGVLDVDGVTTPVGRVVLATGATAAVPPLDGLAAVHHLDNRTVFELEAQPEHLLVVGAGAIGVELSQAFARLGSRVTLIESGPRILPVEEPEAADVVSAALQADGVDVRAGTRVERVTAGPTLHLSDGSVVSGSHLLLVVGRTPVTEGLGLDSAGVAVGGRGEVVTDSYLRTSAPGVFAAGDCTAALQFTHVADEQGRLAAGNAFARTTRLPGVLGGAQPFDGRAVPWVTFTDPEVGRVGMTEQEAFQAYGERARVAVVPLADVDRARTASSPDGYLKVVAGPRALVPHRHLDRVVGLTAVMPSAGELAATGALAMRTGLLVGRLAQAVAPYPTYSVALRTAAARMYGSVGGATWRPARPTA